MSEEEADRLNHEQIAVRHQRGLARDAPPAPALADAAPGRQGRRFRDALCAAVRLLRESLTRARVDLVDWDELRAKLQLKPEPAIDPDRVDIDQLHLSRLSLIPVERLDDDRILALYHGAREWGVRTVMNRVARLIDSRPILLVKGRIEAITLYGELALDAAREHDRSRGGELARARPASPSRR